MVVCAFPVYTAQAPGCSAGVLSKAGPLFQALPKSKFPRFRFSGTPQSHRLSWACVLCPSQVEQLRWPGAWWAHCPRWAVCFNHLPGPSLLVSWLHHESAVSVVPCVSSGELISGWKPPGRCQPSRIPGRLGLATGSLLTVWWRMLVSGAKITPCLLTLAVTSLPLCLW